MLQKLTMPAREGGWGERKREKERERERKEGRERGRGEGRKRVRERERETERERGEVMGRQIQKSDESPPVSICRGNICYIPLL